MSEAYIGVDVGTLSARAGVFDSAGRLIAAARRPIAIWREGSEIVEQSSDDIWRAATLAVREVVEASRLPPEAVAGMGFDATCSLVALDRDARPVSVSPTDAPDRDVIVWMDHRAVEDAQRINAGGHETLRYVGGRISPEMHAPKLAWLTRCKPETIAKASHFFDLTDFLSFRATGSLTRSTCPATCKFGYLAHETRWPDEFFDRIGLGFLKENHYARIGAEIAWPGAPLRRGLTAEAAAAMALRLGTPVGAGLIDAHAGAAGTLGARKGGMRADPRRRLALILGTSSSCMALSDEPRFVDGIWGPHLGALTPNQWLIDGGQSAFGGAIDHLMRLHPAFAELSARTGPNALKALEKDIVARAGGLSEAAIIGEGLHVLPDFIGTRSPSADPGARGGVLGMDLREDITSLQELYVAGLCGLAYGLADIVRKLEQSGYSFDSIVVSGGAAQSALVRQIIADACGKIVEAPETPEPVLLGSAMVGAVAAGAQTMASAMSSMSAIAPPAAAPTGGAVAAFHARKRQAYEALHRVEREIRATARRPHWPEVVIFDCDGVLVDSEPIALAVTRRKLGEVGLRLTDEETRGRFLGLRLDSVVREVETELGAPLPKEFPDDLSREILAAFARDLKGVEGVRQAVEALRARVCVASSSAPERLRLALRVTGYETLFTPNIFSAAEVTQGKPSPDLFLFAARTMSVAPEDCLVIEDSVAGVAAARAAGMTAFGFVGASHFSQAGEGADLTAAGAELIFDDMAQLPELVAARAARAGAARAD
ncbi:MAG TPA: FGGY family pentulose kinase [Roseiarcus sp.]|nr:FGGY family pentulose kinase [Roseiarcus sp.]